MVPFDYLWLARGITLERVIPFLLLSVAYERNCLAAGLHLLWAAVAAVARVLLAIATARLALALFVLSITLGPGPASCVSPSGITSTSASRSGDVKTRSRSRSLLLPTRAINAVQVTAAPWHRGRTSLAMVTQDFDPAPGLPPRQPAWGPRRTLRLICVAARAHTGT